MQTDIDPQKRASFEAALAKRRRYIWRNSPKRTQAELAADWKERHAETRRRARRAYVKRERFYERTVAGYAEERRAARRERRGK